jgi:adhesin transport system membrane fusion protein
MSFAFVRINMMGMLALLLIAFVAWAAWLDIDQTVRSQGQFMPSLRTQVIQAADGGVLAKLLVAEGERVKAGQLVAVLEKDRAAAGFNESRAKLASLKAAYLRASAEAEDTTPAFGSIAPEFSPAVKEQVALYRQRKMTLEDDMRAQLEALTLAKEELALNEKLAASGDVSRLDLIRAKRQVFELQGRMDNTRNKFIQDARQEAARISDELASTRFKLNERESILQHTELTSPLDGVVKYLKINTVGGVLRAGDELMHISPTEGDLIIESKINPVDIGLLRVGLPVTIRLDAFDSSLYGSLQGQLDYISSDTLSEQAPNGQSLTTYRARVKLLPEIINPKLPLSLLKPGMTVTLDIKTGSRSVMAYLLKPIAKAFVGAASER